MNLIKRNRVLAAGFVAVFALAGCTGDAGSSGGGEGSYAFGVSNTFTNNGWREEMICSINAQSVVSGEVSSLTVEPS